MKRYAFEGILAVVFLVALFLVVLLQILGRTGIVPGPIWTEELARWLWVWMALIGIGAVERNRAHLRMGFLIELLPDRGQRLVALLTDLVYLGIAGHLVWIAWTTVQRTSRNQSVTLPTTDAVLYASALVAMVLVVHRIVRRFVSGDHVADATEGTRL